MTQLSRLELLVQRMKDAEVHNLLISDPASIRYLIGYHTHPGERLLLLHLAQDGNHRLYLNQLFPEATLDPQWHVAVHTYRDGEPVLEVVAQHLLSGHTGIDKYWHSHFLLSLMGIVPTLQPIHHTLVDDLRAIKDEDEIQRLVQASRYNDFAMERLFDLVPRGLSERQMVNKLEGIYRQLNGNGFSFEPIIAYGANGADPHHETNDDTPTVGQAVVLDIGSHYKGYCSDMTRTVFYGQPDEESLHVYDVVKRANEAAIARVKPGVTFAEIDRAAREVIEQAGYGDYFTHRTGHFIGQEVHEAGDVSSFNHAHAQVGQVFSIEPGIYLPGKIGVRIEDLVVVTPDGCRVLNQVTKEPVILEPKG